MTVSDWKECLLRPLSLVLKVRCTERVELDLQGCPYLSHLILPDLCCISPQPSMLSSSWSPGAQIAKYTDPQPPYAYIFSHKKF